ncbi:CHASE3 domain-containing protein [Phormidium sp. LEGE 05292]|uniref:CHASE3 domain-containing protein n=1 Tax=[Phormidium] sp. LEGE 05292 TaxID=767427 RepID=UPI00187FCD44|nr:CHASE3 domain-containing protein [Phormidium sp. LEGE 05292]MBE9226531.1 CHASE3 domain-containing protein [Phormidium sp. LEGE 05292]
MVNRNLLPKQAFTQQTWKINYIVPLGFGAVALLVTITTMTSQWGTNSLLESNDLVIHTYEVKADLKDIEKLLVDAETGQRGFLLNNKEEFLDPYLKADKPLKDGLNTIKTLIQDNPAQLQRLSLVEDLVQAKMDELAETIALYRAGKESELKTLLLSGKGKQIMDQIRRRLSEMIEVEENLLSERQKAANQAQQLATALAWGGTGLSVVMGIFVSFVIARIIMRPINQVANTIASSSTEIAVTTEQQERTAVQQATIVNQTTITIDELSASSQNSAKQAEAAAVSAKQALTLTEQGNKTIEQTLTEMLDLKEKVNAIAEQILRLSEQTSQIRSISDVVSDLANQTNMLALNAAVEAVRAGEFGKGFSVVATEIRKLADQSKTSAGKITNLVNDVQHAINSTVMVTDEGRKKVDESMTLTKFTTEAFNGVATAMESITTNNQQIALTASQQAIAIQQVVDAMNSVNQGATETASGISQIKTSTQQLNDAALSLQVLVN